MDYLIFEPFLGLFGHFWFNGTFLKNRASSLFLLYSYLTSCKKSKRNWWVNSGILCCEWMNEQTNEQGQIHKIVPLARVSENKFTYVTRDQLFVLRNFSEKKPRQLVPVAHTYQSSFHWKVSSVLLSRVLVYVPIKNLRTLDFVQRLHEHKSFRSRLSLWHHRLFPMSI